MGKIVLPQITDDRAAARALGVATDDEALFPCPLPGHDGDAQMVGVARW